MRMFHLSFPVRDLDAAVAFYASAFGGAAGRRTDTWADVIVWGHQLTLQLQPGDVLPAPSRDSRHFGVILPWEEWERAAERIRAAGLEFLAEPAVRHEGTPREEGKFYLEDPSGNGIEIKAYRDVAAALRLGGEPARSHTP